MDSKPYSGDDVVSGGRLGDIVGGDLFAVAIDAEVGAVYGAGYVSLTLVADLGLRVRIGGRDTGEADGSCIGVRQRDAEGALFIAAGEQEDAEDDRLQECLDKGNPTRK